MKDYTKELPAHQEKVIGEHDLLLEIFEANHDEVASVPEQPPLLLVHGAFTGSWMWSKYIPPFMRAGWTCYAMNLRGHYRSRVVDLSAVSFEDYLEDIRAVIAECSTPPVLVGFSMGGILCQKLAEHMDIAGLVLIDSSISKETHERAPYQGLTCTDPGIIVPAPVRHEDFTIDESTEDIAFQRKYLTMESAKAFRAFAFRFGAEGIPVDHSAITCPCLVISAVNGEEDDHRGRVMAELFRAEYIGLRDTTHTGLLVGQRYMEGVTGILAWLEANVRTGQTTG